MLRQVQYDITPVTTHLLLGLDAADSATSAE